MGQSLWVLSAPSSTPDDTTLPLAKVFEMLDEFSKTLGYQGAILGVKEGVI